MEHVNPQEVLRDVYKEVDQSFRAIDDVRLKLLSLLPIASGAIITALLNSVHDTPSLVPVGILGAAVTAALFFYELMGILRCATLIDLGQGMERELGWPGPFLRLPAVAQGHAFEVAACIIYSAVFGAWIAVAALSLARGWALSAGIVGACLSFFVGFVWLQSQYACLKNRQTLAARGMADTPRPGEDGA